MTRWRVLLAAGALLGLVAACSDGEAATTTVEVGTAPVDSSASTAAPDTTLAPVDTVSETTVPGPTWDAIATPSDCMCSDGSPFTFFVHRADTSKVMFFLEGGGACFDAGTCGPDSDSFKRTVGHDPLLSDVTSGIFDFANPDNPFRDWSIVFVPYCTGDVHIGNLTKDYGNGVVIHHNGYVNGTTAMDGMQQLFPDATQIVVAGESAGSIPTPLYAGLAADRWPAASIKVLADGSGAYPDVPVVNATIGASWGTMNAVPDWPENKGMTIDRWSIPGLFVQAGAHAPRIVFARHDYAFDATQAFFSQLAGLPADREVEVIDANERQIEASGVTLFSYIAPGKDHTVLSRPTFYTETVEGVSLLQWVTDLVGGTPVSDVHCTKCEAA